MPKSLFSTQVWQVIKSEWMPVIGGLVLLFGQTFYGLATQLWIREDYAHGPVILAVVMWLLWDKREMLLRPCKDVAPVPGLAILLVGLLIYVVGRSQDISILEVGSLIPILAGVLVAMRGLAIIRSLWFMIIFLIYLVPLPSAFVDGMTSPLKQYVSASAEQILYVLKYPVARNGVMLTIGHYQLLVADACSGINSMFSLSAVGLVYLYLIRRKSWAHNAFIVASLLPVAFAANVVRVVCLVLITYHLGDAAGQGFVHKLSGMVLFIVALLSVLLLDFLLARVMSE